MIASMGDNMANNEFVENMAEEIVEMISNTKKIMSLSQDMESLKKQQEECLDNINNLENSIKEIKKILKEHFNGLNPEEPESE